MTKKLQKTILFENEKLLAAARADAEILIQDYGNTAGGFDETQVENLRETCGENIVANQEKVTVLRRIVDSFINPFTIILFVLALVSLFTDVIFASKFGAKSDPTAVIIVLLMVFVSGIMRLIQELRSSNAAEKLKAMINTTTCVLRKEHGRVEIPLEEVVVGDIICLAAGDMIPADVRILSCKDLFVSEASLTGESAPVEKTGKPLEFDHKNPLTLANLAFMGTNVISGSGLAIVISVGSGTYFGRVAKSLSEKRAPSGFEKGINSVSWVLIRFMLVMVPVVFFVSGLVKGVVHGGGGRSWIDSFMFALSVAVGLTPEMLPMIVTAGLAKGAVRMSRQKTVVKNLGSIQNFGAMDVLCTDKTGTLTQDEIALERYLDIRGNEDLRILRHAFLNSYFQTGMKNQMDIAILKHINDNDMTQLSQRYEKVDEIPFDFARRRMSVVIKDESGKTQLITKGAVEEMLSICTHAEYQGEIPLPLTRDIKREILATVEKLNGQGMRVLAVAQKNNPPTEGVFSVSDEADMVLIGYLAFLDPPKQSAKAAIKALSDLGVDVKILTGDNVEVTKCIARQVGIKTGRVLIGSDIEDMSDDELAGQAEKVNIFAKLSPAQKTRIVGLLRDNGHIVGYMGDGINDAAAIKAADVGISVDTAVDIAKESADVILLEKDLMVLERAIIEGRKTFANIVKYIKMTASSNFGNMFSVLAASAFLPFLPMIPLQIIALNLIYDISCISIPWDNVDAEFLQKPQKWDASSISKFMVWIGPASSVFDIGMFALLYFVICPSKLGGSFVQLGKAGEVTGAGFTEAQNQFASLFQTGWFVHSLWSQTLVIHMIRTPKVPFVQSRASWSVVATTVLAVAVGTVIPFTLLGEALDMTHLPVTYFAWLAAIIVAYMLSITFIKKLYIGRYGELL